MSATLVLTNGRIYTIDPRQPTATAVAIRDGRILAVGDDATMKDLLATDGEWLDLDGRCVTPGLVDAHVHFQHYALGLQAIDLNNSTTVDKALQQVEQYVGTIADDQWLKGRGWAQDEWPDRTFPTATQLDTIAPHIPICLYHRSGHAVWVNSKALHLAGIDQHTPDPSGGHIQRDEDGHPTGVLEETAIDLVTQHIPRATIPQIVQAMRQAQERCWQAGLTGLHDFDGRDCFRALQILHQNGELGLRMIKNIPVYRLEHAIGVGLRSGFGDHWLRVGGVKIFADGALGALTAAMIAPYETEPENYGIVVTDKEEMMTYASQASANGLSVTVHAIGDRANHDILDVYQAVRGEERQRGVSPSTLRHRIEHVQILHPTDLERLAQLNIIASMQPTHATTDMTTATRHWGNRTQYSYAWRTMLDTGATLVFGSDAPIEPIEPIRGIHAAVTRCRADGTPNPDGWHPEQRLTIQETIHAFTQAAAITAGQEAHQGAITPGKLADFTIFERDIFTIAPQELHDVAIAGTIVDGNFRYRAF